MPRRKREQAPESHPDMRLAGRSAADYPAPMMTLRQIEVIRAVMISGTITGAAKLLNVSAPGISRLEIGRAHV